jgi:hypothetical protein
MNIPTNIISSLSASGKGTISIKGGDIERRKICDIPRRKSKTNSFQNRRVELRNTGYYCNKLICYLFLTNFISVIITNTI